jgi:uncharacterized protein
MWAPIGLLFFSNIFMTFAWYGHLKNLKQVPVYWVILISWGIAFFEYCLQVPANRMGSEFMTVPQLKIVQEVLTMMVFAGFSFFYLRQPLKLDYLWASFCLIGAVYFMFRNP